MTTEHRPYVHVCHHALHATDRPAKQQLSPKKAMQEPTNVFDKEQPHHDTMIQSYHSDVCHHAMHATDRPAKQQLSPKKSNARAYQCL